MKYLNFIIVFIFCAAVLSEANLNATQQNQLSGKNNLNAYSTESSLVYLDYLGKFLCGSILVGPGKILSIFSCIIDYIPYKVEETDENFIKAIVGYGSVTKDGTPYPVKSIHVEGTSSTSLAVLTLFTPINTFLVPVKIMHIQEINMQETQYTFFNTAIDPAPIIIRWHKDSERNSISKEPLTEMTYTTGYLYTHICDLDNRDEKTYMGGMLIWGDVLIGICHHYCARKKESVALYYIPITRRYSFIRDEILRL